MFQAGIARDAVYGHDWVRTPIPVQRCLMFIIAAANKGFPLTAGTYRRRTSSRWADGLDFRLRYLSALPRTSAPNYGLFDVTGNVHRTWAAFIYGYLCCHTFCPQKPHNATLFYRGTRNQGRRHLVTGVPSLQSCAYRSLHVTIKLDSAAN